MNFTSMLRGIVFAGTGISALLTSGCLLNDGKELIPTEGSVGRGAQITVSTGVTPTYSWTIGPVMQLTVVDVDAPDQPIWGLTSSADIIQPPVVHGTTSRAGANVVGVGSDLINGKTYRVQIQKANGNREVVDFLVPNGTAASLAPLVNQALASLQPAAGSISTLAVSGDDVKSWGADQPAPRNVTGLKGVLRAAAGASHSLAVTGSGEVWAWGENAYGQLGDGSQRDAASPVRVPGLPTITAVAAGARHSLALAVDGTVWAWGDNTAGQLGTGTALGSLAPVQVPGLQGVHAVSAGAAHSVAVTADGAMWAWGANERGQLGNGSVQPAHVPTPVLSGP